MKEVIITRKKRKPAKVVVGGTEIVAALKFAKPKDRVSFDGEKVTGMDETPLEINVSKVIMIRGKIKPGSTQESQHPISAKEIKTGKISGDGGGSYDTSEQSYAKKADGRVYKQDVADYPEFYNNEQP